MSIVLLSGVAIAGARRMPAVNVNQLTPTAVVDSARGWNERLARFRANLPPETELTGGRASRDELVAAFIEAVEANDTALIRSLAITKAEFGYLYYPTTPQAHPPYDLDPALMWLTMFEHSNRGAGRLFAVAGGRSLDFEGYSCPPDASHEGDNIIWGPCTVRVRNPSGDMVDARLFSLIIERAGTYKFLSLSNKLD